MNFKEIDKKIKHYYDSDEDDILNDFYIEVLKRARFYRRLTGAFSSTILAGAAKGMSQFIKNGGKMELICWATLSEKDVKAINDGIKTPNEIISSHTSKKLSLDKIENKLIEDHLKALAWMVSEDLIEIKIAVKTAKDGMYLAIDQSGKFHMKSGLLRDGMGNEICFSGSENESISGWKHNIEQFHVYKSWDENDKKHFESQKKSIQKYWGDKGKSTKVFEFPEATKKKLINFAPKSIDDILDLDLEKRLLDDIKNESGKVFEEVKEKGPIIPKNINLRDYQQDAISEWIANNNKGILKMATGTGKTITALGLIAKLYEKEGRLAIIISCPYQHLVEQWKEECDQFNLNPILCYKSKKKWMDDLNTKINCFNMGLIDHFTAITTHTSFGMETMQSFLNKLEGDNAIVILDEVHHFGAKHLRTSLPENVNYRLGLSATPKDWYDEYRNNILFNYFKKGIVYQYGLKEAIKNGWLTRYYYYPHIVEFTESEMYEYENLSEKISKIMSYEDVSDINLIENEALKYLLFQRARLIGKAENKIKKLKEILKENEDDYYNLIYCGDGKIEDERQIDKVVKMLGRDLEMKVHPFTAEEDSATRKRILDRFENKELHGLVAIRCLDEGVDVPATKNAYILASSTNPRQFIQRRGRILRKHPSKNFSYIHDFILIPPSDLTSQERHNIERKLIEKELSRVNWFIELAENGPEASAKLLNIKEEYSLLHI